MVVAGSKNAIRSWLAARGHHGMAIVVERGQLVKSCHDLRCQDVGVVRKSGGADVNRRGDCHRNLLW
jgi:hypothetical protein